MLSNKIYTIQQKNKTVGIVHNNFHYVIGFKNIVMARNVQYNLHPEPRIILDRANITEISVLEDCMTIDLNSKLYIQKYNGSAQDPLNDGHYHINTEDELNFLQYPIDKMIGVIMPNELLDEDDDNFIFESQVIDPFFKAEFYRSRLRDLL